MTVRLIQPPSSEVLDKLILIRASEADGQAQKNATRLRHLEELKDEDNRLFFTATDSSGEHVAYVQLILENADDDPELANGKDLAHIHDLRVHSQWQRKGIALSVIQQLEQEAKALGFKTLTLGVDSPNTPALNLYRRLGYEEFKSTPGRTDSERCLYLRKLI